MFNVAIINIKKLIKSVIKLIIAIFIIAMIFAYIKGNRLKFSNRNTTNSKLKFNLGKILNLNVSYTDLIANNIILFKLEQERNVVLSSKNILSSEFAMFGESDDFLVGENQENFYANNINLGNSNIVDNDILNNNKNNENIDNINTIQNNNENESIDKNGNNSNTNENINVDKNIGINMDSNTDNNTNGSNINIDGENNLANLDGNNLNDLFEDNNNEETNNQIVANTIIEDIPNVLKTKVIDENNKKDVYTNIYKTVKVRNESSYKLTQEMLTPNVDFNNKKDILIFHTHTCESYTQTANSQYVETANFRTTDLNYSVAKVGDVLTDYLTSMGYNVTHNKTYHDYPSYSGSYNRSYKTVSKLLSGDSWTEFVIDLHRDALGSSSEYAPSIKIRRRGRCSSYVCYWDRWWWIRTS